MRERGREKGERRRGEEEEGEEGMVIACLILV